jgi:endoglucanase
MKPLMTLTQEIFECPTAPFREGWVLEKIRLELMRLRVPYVEDKFGNIISGVKTLKGLSQKTSMVGLIAHTDHPGFHLTEQVAKNTWKARWLGGGPGHHMKGSWVRIHHPLLPDQSIRGKIVKSQGLGKDKRGCDWIWIQVKESQSDFLDTQCFGQFDYPGFYLRGKRIFTRAADDLAGLVTILATYERLPRPLRKHLLGIFTRAEEVGFRGALGVLYQKYLPRQGRYISLEASRTLPGARLGKGPVIRLGDRRSLFDSSTIWYLDRASQELQKQKKLRFQRRIMDGGTCEATPFNLHGLKTAGLAVPLGNYHNQGKNKPGPEYIDTRDLQAQVELCCEFLKQFLNQKDPDLQLDKTLLEGFKKDLKYFNQKFPFMARK